MTAPSPTQALRLLLATDGDQAADAAMELLSAVAARDSRVDVVSAVPTGRPMLRHLQGRVATLDERRRHATVAARSAADELRRAGFDAAPSTPEGRPSVAIARMVDAEGVDVVVVGAANHGPASRLFGSVSEAIVSRASSAVLVVRKVQLTAPTEVLLAVDDEHRADRAIDVTARLLDPSRVRTTVLGVAEVLAPSLTPPHIRHASSTLTRERADAATELLRHHVSHAAGRLRDAGFVAEERVVIGEPVHRIVEEASSLGAGLVVLGGRGLGVVEGALLGSVSRAVLEQVPATLVVPD